MIFTNWETKQVNLEFCIRTVQADSLNWANPEATEMFYDPTERNTKYCLYWGKNENLEPKKLKTNLLIFLS